MNPKSYVLITPARNEEANIEKTLRSVTTQTLPPLRWVIVSDGSTDRTDAIVSEYCARFEYIELVRAPRAGDPSSARANFGSKIKAFDAGFLRVRDLPCAFVGNLDADVSFDPDYFERLLEHFLTEPRLGLAGGLILERFDDEKFEPQKVSDNSVAGAVMFFRRECYDQVGGYLPLKLGGEDSAAEITARMHGWEVGTIRELPVKHHGRVTNGRRSLLTTRFCKGITNYLLGYHPLFQLFVSAYRLAERPYILGGLMMELGYCWAAIRRLKPAVSSDVVRYLRNEQCARLRGLVAGRKASVR